MDNYFLESTDGYQQLPMFQHYLYREVTIPKKKTI